MALLYSLSAGFSLFDVPTAACKHWARDGRLCHRSSGHGCCTREKGELRKARGSLLWCLGRTDFAMNAAFGWLHGKRCSCDAAGLGEIMLDVQQQVREVTKMYRPLNLAI